MNHGYDQTVVWQRNRNTEIDTALFHDIGAIDLRVDQRKVINSLDRGIRNHGGIGQLKAFTLEKLGTSLAACFNSGCHVTLRDRVYMRRGVQ